MAVPVLFVESPSVYEALEGVDLYDRARDARTWPGGRPFIGHPPCRYWSKALRHQAKPEPGEHLLGLWCCEQLRRWGGIVEQPAGSALFDAAGFLRPGNGSRGGVTVIRVNQSWWGHPCRKATWLAVKGVELSEMPFRLGPAWGESRRQWEGDKRKYRKGTPLEFARWLVRCVKKAPSPASMPAEHP